MKKIFKNIFILCIVFLIWTGIAYCIRNPFICPYPSEILQIMYQQLFTPDFYHHIAATIIRTLFAFALSFGTGIILAVILYKQKKILEYFEKLILVLRSIPNVTFIILFLFWLNRENTITAVSFLLLFPIVFQNTLSSLYQIDKKYQEVLKIYPQPFGYTLFSIYIPLMKPQLHASAVTTMALSFKVGVMAEILAQVPFGIGRGMQWAKLNVDLAGVMAWTIWLLIIVFFIHAFIMKFNKE